MQPMLRHKAALLFICLNNITLNECVVILTLKWIQSLREGMSVAGVAVCVVRVYTKMTMLIV